MKTHSILLQAAFVMSLVPACTTEPQGQLVLAFKTDMSLPKDIRRIRVEASLVKTGMVFYKHDFDKFDEEDGYRLPATLGILPSESDTPSVRIRVIASRGSNDQPRVLRDMITTVPQDRTAMLPVPIEFLCDGSAQVERDAFGDPKRDENNEIIVTNPCGDGFTCKAGNCESADVVPESLPEYDEGEIFGGGTKDGEGTCFDTSACFNDARPIAVASDAMSGECVGTVPPDLEGRVINIGLSTQGGGICGEKGCFVALDAESDAGWRALSSNTFRLPPKVCEKINATDGITEVVAVEAADEPCGPKRESIPTCGPWSSVNKRFPVEPDKNAPMFIASGQWNPVALDLTQDDVYWTSKGTLTELGQSEGNGSVKKAPKTGGQPFVIADKQFAPAGMAFDKGNKLVLWTNEQGPNGGSIRWASIFDASTPEGNVFLEQLQQPTGLAAVPDHVFYTELATNQVHDAQTSFDSTLGLVQLDELKPPMLTGTSPRNIDAVDNAVCWTYESKLENVNGVVACAYNGTTLSQIAEGQATPRAIKLRKRNTGEIDVYWANFAAKGRVMHAVLANGTVSGEKEIVSSDFPAGLSVDETNKKLYITSRGAGTIVRVSLDEPSAMPEVVVAGRSRLGAIVQDEEFLYWIEEGEPNTSTGSILRMKKP